MSTYIIIFFLLLPHYRTKPVHVWRLVSHIIIHINNTIMYSGVIWDKLLSLAPLVVFVKICEQLFQNLPI